MNLLPQLSHLPENKIKELEDITSRILENRNAFVIQSEAWNPKVNTNKIEDFISF